MDVNGLLLVDKPSDITSHDVVHQVRRLLGQKSVGHTGTLDPLATGLMILVLGEATKLSDYLVMAEKSYWLKVHLGIETDTLDRTGRILRETPCSLVGADVSAATERLQGVFQWPVPLFSAAKVDGRKLYEHGRAGRDVELPIKTMQFWGVEIEEFAGDRLQLRLSCSKGSFVRTWASELGRALGVGGIVEELRRISVGPYAVNQALTLEQLDTRLNGAANRVAALAPAFIPLAQALPNWKALIASAKDARLIANGQLPRDMENRLIFEQKQAFEAGQPVYVKVISSLGDLLAILAAEPGQGLKIRRVFRTMP